MPVERQQHGDDRRQHQPDGQQAENHQDCHQEKRHVYCRARDGQAVLLLLVNAQAVLRNEQAARRHQRHRDDERPEHDAHEFARRDLKMRVQIQVLRVAKGREHAAEVRRNILQNEHQRHIALAPRRGEDKISQRQEGDQRHIVGNQHGTDERDIRQRKRRRTGVARQTDDAPCENGKKVYVLQRTDDRQRAEQAAERFQIEIAPVLRVRRHQQRGHNRRAQRDQRHGILP